METSKACPICRAVTHFITPSSIWPIDATAKDKIIQSYKLKIRLMNLIVAKLTAVIIISVRVTVHFLLRVFIGKYSLTNIDMLIRMGKSVRLNFGI
jgi:hypothetical protein